MGRTPRVQQGCLWDWVFAVARARGGGRGRQKNVITPQEPAASFAALHTPLGTCDTCRPLAGAFKLRVFSAAANHFCPASSPGCRARPISAAPAAAGLGDHRGVSRRCPVVLGAGELPASRRASHARLPAGKPLSHPSLC